jgi:hypothetical protein
MTSDLTTVRVGELFDLNARGVRFGAVGPPDLRYARAGRKRVFPA